MLLFLNLFPTIQNKLKEGNSEGLFSPRVGGPTRTMDRTASRLEGIASTSCYFPY